MSDTELTIDGVLCGAATAGIKASGNPDIALFHFPDGASWSAVTTRHQLKSAAVRWTEQLKRSSPRRPIKAIVVNSGNANACTGDDGPKAAKAMARAVSQTLDCDEHEVLVSSTGVIGVPLPLHKIRAGIPAAAGSLTASGWDDCAAAIMTTDDGSKVFTLPVQLADGSAVGKVSGIAKGAGMIAPNMATMLCYLCTDVEALPSELDDVLQTAVNHSFNRIIVDGDQSTNDTVVLVATGKSQAKVLEREELVQALEKAVQAVCQELALMIVRDGEGARRIARITVEGALSDTDAEIVAREIGSSPLFKTALYGADPNWGRIAMAAGKTNVVLLEEMLEIEVGGVMLFRRGENLAAENLAEAEQAMQQDTVPIRVRIGKGNGAATVWASDLGYEYVRLNAEYTT